VPSAQWRQLKQQKAKFHLLQLEERLKRLQLLESRSPTCLWSRAPACVNMLRCPTATFCAHTEPGPKNVCPTEERQAQGGESVASAARQQDRIWSAERQHAEHRSGGSTRMGTAAVRVCEHLHGQQLSRRRCLCGSAP
jgi:hypothetical protein